MQKDTCDFTIPWTIYETTPRSPVVFNVPHSGRIYPPSFIENSCLTALSLRLSEDAWVDKLFAAVTQLGSSMMVAHFPRAYLDVNREPYELDPLLFSDRLPNYANMRSTRVAAGLGTIPRIVRSSHNIYPHRIPLEWGMERIEKLYKPYHRALHALLERTFKQLGYFILIDCHSMPSLAGKLAKKRLPNIVLGDRHGTSCAPALTNFVEAYLQMRGYTVLRNQPYAGGFITENYGIPGRNRHALQIEISRALYMDENTLEPSDGFVKLTQDLSAMSHALIQAAFHLVSPLALAAE